MVNIVAGDYLQGAQLATEIKSASDATTKIGDVCTVQTAVWKTAGITQPTANGPFRVAVSGSNYTSTGASTIQTADTSFTALVDGFVYVTADGVINPGDMVTPLGATTAGRVISYVVNGAPTAATASNEWRVACGVYEGHANEGSVAAVPTAAAQNDIIRIRFRGQV